MFKLILDKKNFHPGGVIDNGEEEKVQARDNKTDDQRVLRS